MPTTEIITPYLNAHLEGLRGEEERIRTEAALLINSRDDLKDHLGIIHLCMDALHVVHGQAPRTLSDTEQVLFGLGIRMFNSTACLLKLALSGYYQGAISFLRDVVELDFLLDYFYSNEEKIAVWRHDASAPEFWPKNIRNFLDKRDGFESGIRAQRYKLLSSIGTHASFQGFELLVHNKGLTIGPFFNPDLLSTILLESATHTPHPLISFLSHFDELTREEMRHRVGILERVGDWFGKYRDPETIASHNKEMAELRALIG